jgi:type IV secretory pathway VirB9-like protein
MTKLLKTIYNCETNETIEREMNAEELAQYEADQLAAAQRKAELQTKAAAQTAAQAKLAALGLTTEDLKALGL